MKEIGSFIELDLRNTGEFYDGKLNLARLNSARAGIYHALRLLNCRQIHIPRYLCNTVRDFLHKKGINVTYYRLNPSFEPELTLVEPGSAVLIVNYFGILSQSHVKRLIKRFENVIVDNCQAFYSTPDRNGYHIYSPRKFFGVPDGCYVTGNKAENLQEEYLPDTSSEHAAFLLKRIEQGCSPVYSERMQNEVRIDSSDIMRMSGLTHALLQNIDYESIRKKRMENFGHAHDLYRNMNLLDVERFMDRDSVPMVYPLVTKDKKMVDKLRDKGVYTGRWWNHVLKEVPADSFEAWLSMYMIPIPIDQRYGIDEIQYVFNFIHDLKE